MRPAWGRPRARATTALATALAVLTALLVPWPTLPLRRTRPGPTVFLWPGWRHAPRISCRRAFAGGNTDGTSVDIAVQSASRSGDVDEVAYGDFCVLPDLEVTYARVPEDPQEQLQDILKGTAIFVLPFAGPSVAFALWRSALQLVHSVLGEEKSLLELTQMTLNPTTNGIVVASLAIALGTLTSISVWTLRQRQSDVRCCLNKESCDLALLRSRLSMRLAVPDASTGLTTDPTLDAQVLALMRQYVARILAETSKRADVRRLERQDPGNSELAGITRALHLAGAPSELRQSVAGYVMRLNDSRSQRLATLSTAFPLIHWLILALLASSIAVCFLIEVDQSEGRFVSERPEDSLRLRLVFTILVGTFSGLSALCADLNDLYRGSFNIIGATEQLLSCLAGLDEDLECALVALNPSVTRGDIERAMKAADRDGDGAVDYDEFAAWLQERCRGASPT